MIYLNVDQIHTYGDLVRYVWLAGWRRLARESVLSKSGPEQRKLSTKGRSAPPWDQPASRPIKSVILMQRQPRIRRRFFLCQINNSGDVDYDVGRRRRIISYGMDRLTVKRKWHAWWVRTYHDSRRIRSRHTHTRSYHHTSELFIRLHWFINTQRWYYYSCCCTWLGEYCFGYLFAIISIFFLTIDANRYHTTRNAKQYHHHHQINNNIDIREINNNIRLTSRSENRWCVLLLIVRREVWWYYVFLMVMQWCAGIQSIVTDFFRRGTINHTVHCRTARRITYSLRIVTYQTCLVCVGWHIVSNVRVRTDSNPNLAVVVCRLQFHLCPQIVKFDVGNNIVVLVNNTRTNCFINFRCNDPCRWFGCFLYGRKSM